MTFINQANHYGYLEICKAGTAQGEFTFDVSPSKQGPITVASGSCSPAIKIEAGTVQITEQAVDGSTMVGCETFPMTHQLECDKDALTSTVHVQGGDKTRQTIATIINDKTP